MRLPTEEQPEWLDQHVRSRMMAAFAPAETVRAWHDTARSVGATRAADTLALVLQGAFEGRHVALRWLIDFAGIRDYNEKEEYEEADPLGRGTLHAVRITNLDGGQPIPYSKELDVIWVALTKATAHPTRDSKHEPIPADRLYKAAEVLRRHLQDTIYKTVNKTL